MNFPEYLTKGNGNLENIILKEQMHCCRKMIKIVIAVCQRENNSFVGIAI